MEITRKWFGIQTILLTGFAVVWDLFLVFWYQKALEHDAGLIFVLFPLLHVAVGVGLTYYVVASWVNKTHIYVNNLRFAVRHRPIPWIGNKDIPAGNLAQLYSKEKISRTKNGTRVSYEVRANTKDGHNIKILSGLENQEQALFVEQQVEQYLHIKDASVPGELKT
jgi:hypothetical protein